MSAISRGPTRLETDQRLGEEVRCLTQTASKALVTVFAK